MPRLPQPGGDQGNWGTILNDFLVQAHNPDGVLRDASIPTDAFIDGSITEAKLSTAVQTKLNSSGGGAVDSVNGQTGVVTLTKADIGLANADNTSDANKPISTATQTALDGKAATVHTHTASQISDSTTTGRAVLSAADATAARVAIGAGTSSLVLGTTAGTAKAGDYAPTKADVGLGNVDNTADADKPVSAAMAAELGDRVSVFGDTMSGSLGMGSNVIFNLADGVNADHAVNKGQLDTKADITALLTITDRGDYAPSTSYTRGDIVTYQYARWYRKTTGSGGSSFTSSEWIHLGLYAIGTTSDPGGGMLWIDVS